MARSQALVPNSLPAKLDDQISSSGISLRIVERQPEISVIIPTLNEERNIGSLIRAIRRELTTLGLSFELLIIDGGSSDQTVTEVEQTGTKWIRQSNPGFGGAVRQGMALAEGNWVLLMDADWSHPPSAISELWAAQDMANREGRPVDLIIGSRTVGGASSDAPLYRRFLTWLLNVAFAGAFGTKIRDVSSGFRLYRRSNLSPELYTAKNFNIQVEVLFTSFADPEKVIEVPLRYDKRANGRSNAGVLRDGAAFFKTLWELRVKG